MRASVGSRGTGSKACVVLGMVVSVVLLSVSAANAQGGSFTDKRDGKTYRTVKIGKQTWLAENLNYQTGKSVCYDNADSNCTKYGRLYNWDDAMKACPAGWRLPRDAEWDDLAKAVGSERHDKGNWEGAGMKLKSENGWKNASFRSGNGTDEYRFSALPGGYGLSGGSFDGAGYEGYWWSATVQDAAGIAWYRYMNFSHKNVDRDGNYGKTGLFSLRCSQE